MNPPFFIIGSGRSGSTLLRVILSAHSKITIPPETYYIEPLVKQLPVHVGLDRGQVDQAINIITSHYRWPDMGMTKDYLESKLLAIDSPLLSDITNIIYEYHLLKDKKQMWGDKTPIYVSIVPQLKELYPNAKIINLVRDGRDVMRSFQSTGWYGPWIMDNTKEWREAIGYRNHYKRDRPDIELYEVKYEDLVTETERTIKRLCVFLGVTFEAGMLDWETSVMGKIPAREAHIHKKLNRKPQVGDVSRWKFEMSKREIIITESFSWKELESSGYVLHFKNRLWIIVFVLIRQANYIFIPVYSFMKRVTRFLFRSYIGRA